MRNIKNAIIVIGVDGISRLMMLFFLLFLKDKLNDLFYAQLVTFISYTVVYQSIIEFGSTNLGPRYSLDSDNPKEFYSLLIYRLLGALITLFLILILNNEFKDLYILWLVAYLFFPDWILRSKFKLKKWSLIWLLVVIVGICLSYVLLRNNSQNLIIYSVRLVPIFLATLIGITFYWGDWSKLISSVRFELSSFTDALNFTSGALINRLNTNMGFLISGYFLTNEEISTIGYYLIIYNAISMFKSMISQALFPYIIVKKNIFSVRKIFFINIVFFFFFFLFSFFSYKLFKIHIISFFKIDYLSSSDVILIFVPIVVSLIFILISFFNFVIIHSKVEFKIFRQIAYRNTISLIVLLTFFLVNDISLFYFTFFSLLLIELLSMIQTYYVIYRKSYLA